MWLNGREPTDRRPGRCGSSASGYSAPNAATLQRRVWGDRGGANPEAVRNAIRKLRRKIGDDARNPKYIHSERGLGYRMAEPD
ncbi:MAG: helix-turn-helix domain-containing protein [Gammaproteobacteria bacterium]|nr:helix-turn-helix domain-containing protein [Gammaproteobacteria bacterium]